MVTDEQVHWALINAQAAHRQWKGASNAWFAVHSTLGPAFYAEENRPVREALDGVLQRAWTKRLRAQEQFERIYQLHHHGDLRDREWWDCAPDRATEEGVGEPS